MVDTDSGVREERGVQQHPQRHQQDTLQREEHLECPHYQVRHVQPVVGHECEGNAQAGEKENMGILGLRLPSVGHLVARGHG